MIIAFYIPEELADEYRKEDNMKELSVRQYLHDAYVDNRRLKRALWLARADRALAEAYSVLNDVLTSNRWVKALNKLKAKAEEYK